MFYTLKGILFIYQGQEFGMPAAHYDSIEAFNDIESVNYFYHAELPRLGKECALERINFGSRDNTRHPMCWNSEKYVGFSKTEPWLATHSEYKNVNLEKDMASEKSVFKFYQKLLNLRSNTPAILYGSLNVLSKQEDPFFVFEREYMGEKLVIVCNFEQTSVIETPPKAELLLTNYSEHTDSFRPYEIAVLKCQ